MKIFTRIIVAFLTLIALGVIGYGAWYEWDRSKKIERNRGCDAKIALRDSELALRNAARDDVSKDDVPLDIVSEFPPCAYELVPPPLRELFFGGRDGAIDPIMIRPCDPSATTTDCSQLPVPPPLTYGQPITRYPYETSYPLLDSFYKVNDHLSIHNGLWVLSSESCAADMRTRGVLIDHTEIISRILSLSSRTPDAPWARTLCKSITDLREHTTGVRERTITNYVMVLETQDPIIFSGPDMDLPGTAYRVFIGTHEFIVSPGTGRIYTSSTFDGSLGEDIGGLWDEYTNAEVGVAFSYPYTDGNQGKWGTASGDTGRIWSATIRLPEYDASISLAAKTADYSASKGGHPAPTEGFIEKGGTYYILSRGEPVERPFIPDVVWQSADGRPILVRFAKRETYDFTADYREPPIQATISTDSGAFTGIGAWFGKDGSVFPNADDIEIFKRVITSLHATP